MEKHHFDREFIKLFRRAKNSWAQSFGTWKVFVKKLWIVAEKLQNCTLKIGKVQNPTKIVVNRTFLETFPHVLWWLLNVPGVFPPSKTQGVDTWTPLPLPRTNSQQDWLLSWLVVVSPPLPQTLQQTQKPQSLFVTLLQGCLKPAESTLPHCLCPHGSPSFGLSGHGCRCSRERVVLNDVGQAGARVWW